MGKNGAVVRVLASRSQFSDELEFRNVGFCGEG